jgi:hypothetical protein
MALYPQVYEEYPTPSEVRFEFFYKPNYEEDFHPKGQVRALASSLGVHERSMMLGMIARITFFAI